MVDAESLFSWFIRFSHVMFGVMWVGGAGLWTMVIAPRVLQRGPPPIRKPFLEAALPSFTRMMIVGSLGTIVTGFWTMGLIVGFSNIGKTFSSGAYGIGLGVGAVLAVAMAVEGFAVIKPGAHKLLAAMQKLPANAPPTPEQQAEIAALGKKVGIAGMISFLMGVLALGAMTVAVHAARVGF